MRVSGQSRPGAGEQIHCGSDLHGVHPDCGTLEKRHLNTTHTHTHSSLDMKWLEFEGNLVEMHRRETEEAQSCVTHLPGLLLLALEPVFSALLLSDSG